MEDHQEPERGQAQRPGDREVAARHREDVTEEDALEVRRRFGRQGEQRAEPEQRRDGDRDGGVAAESRDSRYQPDRRDPPPMISGAPASAARTRPGSMQCATDSAAYGSP